VVGADRLRLTLACGDYDINRGLIEGVVQPEGIELVPLTLSSPERHWRMMRGREFDVCELSLGSYLMIRDQRSLPFIAIPAFPHRRFRHGYIFVNGEAGIERPKDLEGRKVGIRTWQVTAGLWIRGILEEQYGVDLSRIEWFRHDQEDIPFELPERFRMTQLGRDQNVSEMLAEGELDALIYPEVPSTMKRGDRRVRRLFSDPGAEERRFYAETGLFPLMHAVVIEERVLAERPEVATSLLEAFRASKRLAWERMDEPEYLPLVWGREAVEEQRALMGRDPWAYELPKNRPALEAMLRYAHRQGLVRRAMEPEELFFPGSLGSEESS
jgi:4,5-dihydroxyphthalate decarboxylase